MSVVSDPQFKNNNSEFDSLTQKYRVTTNGLRYRVERLDTVGMLWWKRDEWSPVRILKLFSGIRISRIIEYSTQKDAEDRKEKYIAERRAQEHGWKSINISETEYHKKT